MSRYDVNYEPNHLDDLIETCRSWRAKGSTFEDTLRVLAMVYEHGDVFLAWKAAEILDS